MKKIIILTISIIIFLGITVYATTLQTSEISVSNYHIDFGIKPFVTEESCPVFIFNDRTYVPLRSFAEQLGKEVLWIEEDEQIYVIPSKPKEMIIKSEDTALEIGKALLKEKYSNRISDKTGYAAMLCQSDHIGARDFYKISVIFSAPNECTNDARYLHENADVTFCIYCDNGSVQWETEDKGDGLR